MDTKTELKTVLHVGCGSYNPKKLPKQFDLSEWREIRLDIDPAVKPDIISDITDMHMVESESVDAIWSSHNIEHLYPHQVVVAFKEFWRVLKVGGLVYMTMPDIQAVARHVAEGNLETPLYVSPAGPISAIDILFGFRPALAAGHHFMAHKTGFTAQSLSDKLSQAGFQRVDVKSVNLDLWASGYKV